MYICTHIYIYVYIYIYTYICIHFHENFDAAWPHGKPTAKQGHSTRHKIVNKPSVQ